MIFDTLEDYQKKESNCQKTDEIFFPTPNNGGLLGTDILNEHFVLFMFFLVGSKC